MGKPFICETVSLKVFGLSIQVEGYGCRQVWARLWFYNDGICLLSERLFKMSPYININLTKVLRKRASDL